MRPKYEDKWGNRIKTGIRVRYLEVSSGPMQTGTIQYNRRLRKFVFYPDGASLHQFYTVPFTWCRTNRLVARSFEVIHSSE
jgi:hypothetical protein